MLRDVFVSYARKDIARVEPLVAALSRSVNVWWDQELGPGEPWRRILLQRLSTTDGLVVCWSDAAVASIYVAAEAKIALERALLLPVMLGPCEPPPPFDDVHALDLSRWSGSIDDPAFRRLLAAIDRNHWERHARDRFLAAEQQITALFERVDLARVHQDAEAGTAVAQSLLGHALVFGTKRVPRDLATGIHWLERAAQQGIADAAATLGTTYILLTDPADWSAATHWLERAAEQGHVEAARELAQIFTTGFEGIEKNVVRAEHYAALALAGRN